MSRLATMSDTAIRAFFAQETGDGEIILLTITMPASGELLRFTSSSLQRLPEEDDIDGNPKYGVVSRGISYYFLPFQISLPEDGEAAPQSKLSIDGVTRILTPYIRQCNSPLPVLIEVVRLEAVDELLARISGLKMKNIVYNADTVKGDLVSEIYADEAFPAHSYTPAYFTGLF